MPPRIEERVFGERSGRNNPYDGTSYRRLPAALLRLGRVFHLLAHGDAEALADEAREIGLGGMHWHAAHRNVLALMLAALGQLDVERRRGFLQILEEQLVEIAHAIEQQAIGMRALEIEILRHRRRRFGRSSLRLGRRFAHGFRHGGKLAENPQRL